MTDIFFGIDTSNYKTSVAAVDEDGLVLAEKSVLLDVPVGARGMRQSDAFFHHSNRLPGYIEELFDQINAGDIRAIGVSERPRRVEGSYMPCFLAGVNTANTLGAALAVPVYGFSHQEGHAAAVIPYTADDSAEMSLFMHLSGGTTEFLLCRPDRHGFETDIAGGTRDISIGQLIDRFGVAAGAPFPAGSYLDEIAYNCFMSEDRIRSYKPSGILPKVSINDGFFNLSGAETRLLRYTEKEQLHYTDDNAADVIAELFYVISDLLLRSAAYLTGSFQTDRVWMAGGVASSRTVRHLLGSPAFEKYSDTISAISFGDPKLSGDNAVGIARLACRMHK